MSGKLLNRAEVGKLACLLGDWVKMGTYSAGGHWDG